MFKQKIKRKVMMQLYLDFVHFDRQHILLQQDSCHHVMELPEQYQHLDNKLQDHSEIIKAKLESMKI